MQPPTSGRTPSAGRTPPSAGASRSGSTHSRASRHSSRAPSSRGSRPPSVPHGASRSSRGSRPLSGPRQHAAFGRTTPATQSRAQSGRTSYSQYYADSESAFTGTIDVDLGALHQRLEGQDAAAEDDCFLDPEATLLRMYQLPAHEPSHAAAHRGAREADGASLEDIDDLAGVAFYRHACARRDMHPSAVVVACLRRNQARVSFNGVHLGPFGAECVSEAIRHALTKSVEQLSFRRSGIASSGLLFVVAALLALATDDVLSPGTRIAEDDRAHSSDLRGLDLSGNRLADSRQLVMDAAGILPLVANDAVAYAASESARVQALLARKRSGTFDPADYAEDPDPYAAAVRATAILDLGQNNPRPFYPPKKLSEEEVKKAKMRGGQGADGPEADPSFAADLGLHQKLRDMHLAPASVGVSCVNILMAGCHILSSLDLSGNGLDDAFVAGIVRSLADHKALTVLSLADNRITDAGAFAIASTLWASGTLLSLDLSGNQVSERGAALLGVSLCKESAKGSLSLEALNVSGNRIGDLGGAFLLGCLTEQGWASLSVLKAGDRLVRDGLAVVSANTTGAWKLAGLKSVQRFRAIEAARCGLQTLSCLQLCKLLTTSRTIGTLDVSGNVLENGFGLYSILRALVTRMNDMGSSGALQSFAITNRHIDAQMIASMADDAGEGLLQPDAVIKRVHEMVPELIETIRLYES